MAVKAQAKTERRQRREDRIRAAVRKREERMERLARRTRASGSAFVRLLSPVFALAHRALAWVAPHITRALLAAVRLPAVAIASMLDFTQALVRTTRSRLGPVLTTASALIQRYVTPVNTVMVVGIGAAIALAASQFLDYTGTAVGGSLYQGDAANVAPVPLTDVEKTGSAHLYVMLPLALAAIALIVLVRRGRWRLGWAVAGIGLVGIAVTLLIDRPAALDPGPLADAYADSDAKLLDGYWAQMVASIGLVVFGIGLGAQVRSEAGDGDGERRRDRAQGRLRGRRKFIGSARRREVKV
jgi:hypothetical protein